MYDGNCHFAIDSECTGNQAKKANNGRQIKQIKLQNVPRPSISYYQGTAIILFRKKKNISSMARLTLKCIFAKVEEHNPHISSIVFIHNASWKKWQH